MKKIGLIGGVGWRSSAEYYRLINEAVEHRLGGLHSARLTLESLDFAAVRRHVDAGDEEALVGIYVQAARNLQDGGAEILGLCSNAAHARIRRVCAQVKAPFVAIGDPLTAAAHASGFARLGLLGTRETMSRPFFKDMLRAAGFEVLAPAAAEQDWLHSTIFGVLEQGRETGAHRARLLTMIDELAESGAQAVVLGCTELPLLLGDASTSVPCLDTMRLHAGALVEAAFAAH